MEVTIEYCGTCNYRPIAAKLAAEIEKETGIRSRLVHSHRMGVFEVTADGEVIFSMLTSGRFPEPSEVVPAIRKKTKGA